ncbi:hypothetical protein HOU00_gp429 [Caulobacter phage CcrPW]|uniref:Uncharacterized protein n=1 Tax=Caulobacter phage CcrPW TaxID=2283271 RepID=A0A385EAD3_9CAUD|nr:hypothetical protein HOU00_gp429 [Caulobacter phage CcrPW]AXQ68696.1 hypothetical protein CcrPW_gp157c [Caulobacter phage CcrPW]
MGTASDAQSAQLADFIRLLKRYRQTVVNATNGGPPGDGQWCEPQDLIDAEDRAETALCAFVDRLWKE